MDAIYQFLIVVLTAIVLQNAVFTRGLGSSKGTLMMSSPKKILFFGGTLTFIAVFSSLLAWALLDRARQHLRGLCAALFCLPAVSAGPALPYPEFYRGCRV